MNSISLSNEIKEIIKIIKEKGYEAYVVGGYPRDFLLKKKNFDIDITTSATPDTIKDLFKNYKLEETFMNLGSVKFKINEYNIEITTFRKEYDYINHRKPSKIEFTTILEEDLKRRDFTINALCYDGENFVDLFNGITDLKRKKIMTIGDPNLRFEEDSLRILRAIRFAAKLNFKLDNTVLNAIKNNYKYLDSIPFETKHKELQGILEAEHYLLQIKKHKNIFEHVFSLKNLSTTLFKNKMPYEVKEALFFYYTDTANINNKYLLNRGIVFQNNKIDLKRKLNKYGKENIYNILYFRKKILKKDKKAFNLLCKIIKNNECFNLKMLNVNGNDLMNLNIEKNKIGEYLDILLNKVIDEEILNKKEILIEYLKKEISESEEKNELFI